MKFLIRYFFIVIYSSTVWASFIPQIPSDVDLIHLHYPDEDIIPYPCQPLHCRYPFYRRKHEQIFSLNEQVYPHYSSFPHHQGGTFHDDPKINSKPQSDGHDSTNINITPINIQGNPSNTNDITNEATINTQVASPPHMINKPDGKHQAFDFSGSSVLNSHKNEMTDRPYSQNNQGEEHGNKTNYSTDFDQTSGNTDSTKIINNEGSYNSPLIGSLAGNWNSLTYKKPITNDYHNPDYPYSYQKKSIPYGYNQYNQGYGPIEYGKNNYINKVHEESFPYEPRIFQNHPNDYYGNNNNNYQNNHLLNLQSYPFNSEINPNLSSDNNQVGEIKIENEFDRNNKPNSEHKASKEKKSKKHDGVHSNNKTETTQ